MTGPTATTTGHGLAGRAASMIKEGKSVGCRRQTLDGARNFQRKAQFYLDFLEAENSTGFHTPQEAASILGESIDASRKGQLAAQKVK